LIYLIEVPARRSAFTVDAQKSGSIIYTRNSVRYAGASEGLRAGLKSSRCTLNFHTQMGLVQ
jgi:hypothetical protein